MAKYGFGNRVCNDWNMLPDCTVNAVSVNCFKRLCLLFYGISALRLCNANNDSASPHHGHCLSP